MYKSLLLLSLVVLAGCSRPAPTSSNFAAPAATAPAAAAATPEPVAPVGSAPAPASSLRPEVAGSMPVAITIPRGTGLRVRLDGGVDTRRNRAGDGFTATVERPVVVGGRTVIHAGARVRGHLTEAAASGRMKGRPVIGLTLDSVHVDGREVRLSTSRVERVGPRHRTRNIAFIGGGAGLGAAIGAIAGGGKGAAIGAAAGAGAGTAGAAATGKEQIGVPAESILSFTLRAPARVE